MLVIPLDVSILVLCSINLLWDSIFILKCVIVINYVVIDHSPKILSLATLKSHQEHLTIQFLSDRKYTASSLQK
jgi:hypothetical protein